MTPLSRHRQTRFAGALRAWCLLLFVALVLVALGAAILGRLLGPG